MWSWERFSVCKSVQGGCGHPEINLCKEQLFSGLIIWIYPSVCSWAPFSLSRHSAWAEPFLEWQTPFFTSVNNSC